LKLPFFNKSILSIDLGTYETKIIEAKRNNNIIQVNKAFSLMTPESSYEDGRIKNDLSLKEAIREGLKEYNIASRTAYLTIKSTSIITREIPFPLVEPKEIGSMLKFQLAEYLPMDISRYKTQHKVLGRIFDGEKEKLNVLIFAIPKDIIDKHYFLLSELDLKPEILDYQSNSISKLIKYTDAFNDGILVSDKVVVTIDLGHSNTNVSIIKNGKLQTSRTIEIGGKDIDENIKNLFDFTKDELLENKLKISDVSVINNEYTDQNRLNNVIKNTIENIIDKIDNIIKYYISKEIENEIHMILLYGGLSRIKGVDKIFGNYFNIDTVILSDVDEVSIQTSPYKYFNCLSTLLRDEEVQ